MGVRANIDGTSSGFFQISLGGPALKASNGNLEAKNASDAAYVGISADGIRIGSGGYSSGMVTWASAYAPGLAQDDLSTDNATGQTLSVRAQNATGNNATGGPLYLSSGAGTAAAGNIELRTGGTARLTVSPTSITFGVPVSYGSQYISFGTPAATTGDIRVANNSTIIAARNAANDANVPVLSLDSSNNVYFGSTNAGFLVNDVSAVFSVYVGGGSRLYATSSYFNFTVPLILGASNQATAGDIRTGNQTLVVAARNYANNGNLWLLSTGYSNNFDQIIIGNSTSGINTRLDVTNNIWQVYSTNTLLGQMDASAFQLSVSSSRFDRYQTNPTFGIQQRYEDSPVTNLYLKGQDAYGSAVNNIYGGGVIIQSGKAVGAAVYEGSIYLYGGTRHIGTFQIQNVNSTQDCRFTVGADAAYFLFAANGSGQGVYFQAVGTNGFVAYQTRSVYFYDGNVTYTMYWALNATGATNLNIAPGTTFSIGQDTQTSDVASNHMSIAAQAAFPTSNRAGGNLALKSGKSDGTQLYEGQIQLWAGSRLMGTFQTQNTASNEVRFIVASTAPYFLFEADQPGQSIYFQAIGANGYIAYQTSVVIFMDASPVAEAFRVNLSSAGTTSLAIVEGTTFQIQQTTRSSDAVVHDITIAPQRAFATATNNKKSANLVVDLGLPMNGGTSEARFIVKRSGSFYAGIGPYEDVGGSYSALYLGPGLTPTSGNYAVVSDGINLWLNAPNAGSIITFGTAGGGYATMLPTYFAWAAAVVAPTYKQTDNAINSAAQTLTVQAQNNTSNGQQAVGGKLALTSGTGVFLAGNVELQTGGTVRVTVAPTQVTIHVATVLFPEAVASPIFQQTTRTTDATPQSLTLQPQWPYASATGANRKPGDLIVNLGAPTNSGIEDAAFIVERNGVHVASLGYISGGLNPIHALWLGPSTASTDSYSLLTDGTSGEHLHVNAGDGGTLYLEQLAGPCMQLTQSDVLINSVPVTFSSNLMSFSENATDPTIEIHPRTVDDAVSNLYINGQAPKNNAANFKSSGSVVISTYPPVTGGITGSVQLCVGQVVGIELGEPQAGKLVVGLAVKTLLTNTMMPANSGDGVIYIANAASAPGNGTPVGGGILYSTSGALHWKGTSGTDTTIGLAEPHCPRCGRDFAFEAKNDKNEEHLALCWSCFTDEAGAHGMDVSKFAFIRKLKKVA